MDENPERKRHYPEEENVPLSTAISEAVEAHERSSFLEDELTLYDHVDRDALDNLFRETDGVSISVQIHLPNTTVSVWNDGGIDIRVTEKSE